MRYRPSDQATADLFTYSAKGGPVGTLRRAIKGARQCRVESGHGLSVGVTKASLLRAAISLSSDVERFEIQDAAHWDGTGLHVVRLVALDADDNERWSIWRGNVFVY